MEIGEVEIYVGSSSKNSHQLIKHYTTKRHKDNTIVFKFGIEYENGRRVVLAEKIFEDNNGKAGKLLKTRELHKNTKGL
jgi:hypothetical protein